MRREQLPRFTHIRTKYTLQILFIIVVVTVLITVFALYQFQRAMNSVAQSVEEVTGEALFEQMERRAELVVTTLADNLISPFYYGDGNAIQNLIASVESYSDVSYVHLYGSDGRMIVDRMYMKGASNQIAPDIIDRRLVPHRKVSLNRKRDILEASVPVDMLDNSVVTVKIGFYLDKIRSDIARQRAAIASFTQQRVTYTIVASIVISGFLILLGILFSVKIAEVLVSPIVKLAEAARKIGKGDLDVSVNIRSGDELEELAASFNQMARDLRDRREELQMLHNSAKTIATHLDLDSVLDSALHTVKEIVKASKASIMLIEEGDQLVTKRTFGWKDGEKPRVNPFFIGEGVAGYVAETKESILANDVNSYPLFKKYGMKKWQGCRHLLCVPIMYENDVKGVINIQDRIDGEPFTQAALEYAEIIASYVGLSIRNIELLAKEMEKLHVEHELKTAETLNEQLKAMNRKLEELSVKDHMTDLYNYRYFSECSDRLLKQAERKKKPLSCVFIDIDLFKTVNDTCNHQFGDYVLCQLGSFLKSLLRKEDVLARYAGDEFVVLLPEAGYDGAIATAKEINKEVKKVTFSDKVYARRISISAGVSSYPADRITDKDQLVKYADEALYEAKRRGRDMVLPYREVRKNGSKAGK